MEVTPNHTQTVAGWAAMDESGKIVPFVFKRRENGVDDVTIKVKYCGMCHTDLHFIHNDWGITMYPVVPGHEVTGVVTKVGTNVAGFKVGDRVGVGCIAASCLDCEHCRRSEENYCDKVALTYNGIFWDGSVTYGGYSGMLVAHKRFVVRIPDTLPLDAAAPLLCAGVTVYTPLKEYVTPGMRVGVVGIGGLGHLALQFVKALDATPVAFSHSASKEQEARSLGAAEYVVMSNAAQVAKASQSVDVLLVTANGKNQPFNTYIGFVKLGGKLVLVGAPEDNVVIAPFTLIASKVSVLGSNIGGIKDTKDMLALAAARKVLPIIQKMPMSEANKGIELVDQGKARFRVVLEN